MEFVTVEIAKKLKENGFNYPCVGHYINKQLFIAHYNINAFHSDKNESIDAPTVYQVLKWLREEHHLLFEVVSTAYGYNLIISDTPDKGGTDRYYSHANDDGPNYAGAWDNYEDCVMYGIEYTLDNLI